MKLPQRKLNWRERLRLLFTGDPYRKISKRSRELLEQQSDQHFGESKTKVPAIFTCELECHNRDAFQHGAGRFVTSERPFTEDGKIDFRSPELKPESEDVWILTLKDPSQGNQALRAQGSTLENAQQSMSQQIANQFWTWFYQRSLAEFEYGEYGRINREYSTLRAAVEAKFGVRPDELLRGFEPKPNGAATERWDESEREDLRDVEGNL